MSVDTPKYRAQAAALGTIIDSICEALADPAHPEESPVDAARRIVRERDGFKSAVAARNEEIRETSQAWSAVEKSMMQRGDKWSSKAEEFKGERDALADLVGATIVRASLAPGETAASDGHALTAAVDQLRARAEQAEDERDSARRMVCDRAGTARFDVAKRHGWGYLYD